MSNDFQPTPLLANTVPPPLKLPMSSRPLVHTSMTLKLNEAAVIDATGSAATLSSRKVSDEL